MKTLMDIYLEGIALKTITKKNNPGGFAGGIQSKTAPHTDSGWNYHYSREESDMPSDDTGQRDNEYDPIEEESDNA